MHLGLCKNSFYGWNSSGWFSTSRKSFILIRSRWSKIIVISKSIKSMHFCNLLPSNPRANIWDRVLRRSFFSIWTIWVWVKTGSCKPVFAPLTGQVFEKWIKSSDWIKWKSKKFNLVPTYSLLSNCLWNVLDTISFWISNWTDHIHNISLYCSKSKCTIYFCMAEKVSKKKVKKLKSWIESV